MSFGFQDEVIKSIEERVHDIISAHRVQTGNVPESVHIPAPKLMICGVRVRFHDSVNWTSLDPENAMHHHFAQVKK